MYSAFSQNPVLVKASALVLTFTVLHPDIQLQFTERAHTEPTLRTGGPRDLDSGCQGTVFQTSREKFLFSDYS